MKRQKYKTQYPNVRYFEHATRKMRNGQADRYFTIRYQLEGKSIEECLGWTSEGWNAGKAHKVLGQIKSNIKTGLGPQSLAQMRQDAIDERTLLEQEASDVQASNILLQDFFEQHYIPEAKRTKRSWLTDAQRFNKIIKPALGLKTMRAITKNDVQVLIDSLVASGAAASTIKQYRSILNHIFTLASQTVLHNNLVFEGLSPVKGVKIPPVKNARDRFLSGKEATLLIEAASKLPNSDLHDCIVISLNTGLRLGEIQRLDWLDVDLTNSMLTVRDEAFRKPGGKVPLNEAARNIFITRKTQYKDICVGLVFPPILGTNNRCNLSHAFKSLADSVGLNEGIANTDRARRIVFHSLRHTFASWLAIGGTDIYRIQKLMRHKTITMTMRYAHLIPDATRAAVHNLTPPD